MASENKKFKILMCSRPGGDRGPGLTFSHHVDALNQDKLNEFIEFLDDRKKLGSKGFKPYDFEKLGVDIFTILNGWLLKLFPVFAVYG